MKKWRLVLLVSWLMLHGGLPNRTFAQPPNVTFEHLSEKDGLPGGAVYSIAKDRRGFVWFGTRRCPARYDGAAFRSFLFPETYLITGMVADSANRMWVATDRQGLCRIDPSALRLKPVLTAPRSAGYLYASASGEGWFSRTDGIGRVNFKTDATDYYPLPRTTYQGPKAKGFLEDKRGVLWALGSDNGLFRFDRRANRFVCVLGRDCPDPARRFQTYLSQGCVDAEGILWIGAFANGLLRFDPVTEQYTFLKIPGEPNRITCVAEGRDENGRKLLWVGDERGLWVFRPEQGRFFYLANLLPAPFGVNAIFRDPANGIVWIGTSDGVLKYNPRDNLVRTIPLPPTLVHLPVTVKVIVADRRDTTGETFWLGLSHTGLLRWHRPTNRFDLIRYPSDAAETMWIEQPDDGRLWVGLRRWDYRGDGVLVYDPSQNRFVPNAAAQRAGTLFSVPFVDHGLIDKQQRLWVGNNDEGLRVLDVRTGEVLPYWADSTIAALHRNNNFLTDLKTDARGRIWLGTYRGPYYVADSTRRFVSADARNPKSSRPEEPATNSVMMARNGHLWAARWGSVTEQRPDGQLLTVLTARDGLYDRENRRLAEDRNGTIWIGNFDGLNAYYPAMRRLRRLTVSDGLSRNNTTAALYVHRGTQLFIGQENGLDFLDVQRVNYRSPIPPLVFSSFQVHERERAFDSNRAVRLQHDDAFSVDFTTLTYSQLPATRYAYFLEGQDEQWHYIGTAHRAYYTNLAPGHYVLHLKAADAFGNWNRQTRQLAIDVIPAWFQTWWFRAFVALSVIGLLYGLYRYRVGQLVRVLNIRNRISADLHDEIGSSLSGINIMGTMVRENLPAEHPSRSLIERIVSESRQVSGSLDDIVWSINPRNDELSQLVARMNRYAAELFEAAGISYEIRLPEADDRLKLPMEKRQDFYLIFKEAVNNLVKHAGATEAKLSIVLDERYLQLELADNGRGFDPEGATERNGLRNMRSRAERLGGKIKIRSGPEQGTTLQFRFPVPI